MMMKVVEVAEVVVMKLTNNKRKNITNTEDIYLQLPVSSLVEIKKYIKTGFYFSLLGLIYHRITKDSLLEKFPSFHGSWKSFPILLSLLQVGKLVTRN